MKHPRQTGQEGRIDRGLAPATARPRRVSREPVAAAISRPGTMRGLMNRWMFNVRGSKRRAFTLIELLVVLIIISILLGIGLPVLKGFGQSNRMNTAGRQLVTDLNQARQTAISQRTTVYVAFLPGEFWNGLDPVGLQQSQRLLSGQYTSYAVVTRRSVGDQLGRPAPRYLTTWRSLPEGTFIAPYKFNLPRRPPQPVQLIPATRESFPIEPFSRAPLPFPSIHTNSALQREIMLPFVAYNPSGQLVEFDRQSRPQVRTRDEFIPLTRGSIFYARDPSGALVVQPPDIQETPPGNSIDDYNVVRIDWTTGRASIERREIIE